MHPTSTNDLTPTSAFDSVTELIGRTPIVKLCRLTKDVAPNVEVWVKLELHNPSGSIEDRLALRIFRDAIAQGTVGAGQTLIDAVEGQVGASLAMVGATLQIPVKLVMPETVPDIYKRTVALFGADVMYTKSLEDSERVVRELVASESHYFFADHRHNEAGARAHASETAEEIWRQTQGRITHFVTGNGPSLVGTAVGLKNHNPDIVVVGHTPQERDPEVGPAVDRWVTVSGLEGLQMAEVVARAEGIACGGYAGANIHAAMLVAQGLTDGVVVTFACGHADREFGERP